MKKFIEFQVLESPSRESVTISIAADVISVVIPSKKGTLLITSVGKNYIIDLPYSEVMKKILAV